jgi:hypothetical protein
MRASNIFDVLHDLREHEEVRGAELFGLQGLEQLLAPGMQPERQIQDLIHGFAGDECLDHGAGALTVDVGDQHIEPDARIGQHLVQPVLLQGQHPAELLALAGNQPEVADVRLWDERTAQQPGARQRGQPVRIAHVGLASGHVFDVPRIDHPRSDTLRIQRSVRALPVNAGTLHHHHLRGQRACPLGQGPAVTLEGAKLPLLDDGGSVRLLYQRAGTDLGLVHVQSDHTFVDRGQFHGMSPWAQNITLKSVQVAHGHHHSTACQASPTALFNVRCPPPPKRRCQAIRGTSEWRRVELGFAVVSHQKLARPLPTGDSHTTQVSFMIGGASTPPTHAS